MTVTSDGVRGLAVPGAKLFRRAQSGIVLEAARLIFIFFKFKLVHSNELGLYLSNKCTGPTKACHSSYHGVLYNNYARGRNFHSFICARKPLSCINIHIKSRGSFRTFIMVLKRFLGAQLYLSRSAHTGVRNARSI